MTCNYHKLSSLNLDLPLLEVLDCGGGVLKELDLSHFPALKRLYCNDNELSDIDLKKCSNLVELGCSSNELVELDVSNNTKLKSLNCDYNYDLETIWVWENAPVEYGIYGRPYVKGWTTPMDVKFIEKK